MIVAGGKLAPRSLYSLLTKPKTLTLSSVARLLSLSLIPSMADAFIPPRPCGQTCRQAGRTTNACTTDAKPSFYKRSLPDQCTAFSSRQGKALFASALQHHGLRSFFCLMEQYTTQSEPAYCGISTLVVVLNALAVDPHRTWKGPWRWYHEHMLNCCIALEDVQKTGITLRDFVYLSLCQGLSVQATHCEGDEQLEAFRKAVAEACIEDEESDSDKPMQILVVSYSRQVLGQTGTGHFSPIAAYDQASDKVLVLDTARFKYGAHWVDLPTMFNAMRPHDPETNRSRGFALLSFEPVPGQSRDCEKCGDNVCDCPQPASLLYRSKLSADALRREYMAFVDNKPDVTWKDVYSFWTQGESHDELRIWQMIEPLVLQHVCEHDVQMKSAVQELVTSLVEQHSAGMNVLHDQFTDPESRKYSKCFSATNTIFVLYLASIPEDQRRAIVMDNTMNASDDALSWLLNEAHLVSLALTEVET